MGLLKEGLFYNLVNDCLISFIWWPRSHQVMNCWTSGSQALTDYLGLANSYHHLRVFCLFIKAGWPTVSPYLFYQHFNVHEYLEYCTLISDLLHIYSRMKLAYCILLISLFRQTCQEKIVDTSAVSGSGRPETPTCVGENCCTDCWSVHLSLPLSFSGIWGRRWSLSHVSCRVGVQLYLQLLSVIACEIH